MNTLRSVLLGVLLAFLCAALIYIAAMTPRGASVTLLPTPTQSPLVVYVSGAVRQPGIYTLPRSSRLTDAIDAAGGLVERADREAVNLAQFLRDGEKIVIPEIGVADIPPAAAATANSPASVQFPIRLNTASQVELEALPGIGATRAQDIIQYREANGDFLSIEDIQKVPGIGPGIFERVKTLITVDP